MGRLERNIARLCSIPKDYTWDELVALLGALGFKPGKGNGGSAVAFRHSSESSHVIRLHRPHGRNPPTILRIYLEQTVRRLKEWGYINEDV